MPILNPFNLSTTSALGVKLANIKKMDVGECENEENDQRVQYAQEGDVVRNPYSLDDYCSW